MIACYRAPMSASRPAFAFLLIAAGTALGVAGTDLVLPAVPELPKLLGGTAERAQLVLAAFTAGSAAGLPLFGALGARFDQRRLLVLSLLAYAGVSALCSASTSLEMLIALRFVQGAAGAAAAVFAPGMLRALYGDSRAVSAIGLLGTIEALAPALAPVVGFWLLRGFGWRATFDAITILAVLVALADIAFRDRLPMVVSGRNSGGYARLLRHPEFLRQSLSHAFTLGALLVIVFGAPTVFVDSLGGTLSDFIAMQILGIALFAIAANMAGRLARRFGAARTILIGTALAATGALAILCYGLAGGRDTHVVTGLFFFVNAGLGLRGPPGFHAAIVAAEDDARGAALLVVAILLTAALGTAAVAPFISHGLVAIGTGGAALACAAVAILLVWRPAVPEQ
jgi:DHA1 family bicyclomycin/chloramphenicol resistance-like MFS transporter